MVKVWILYSITNLRECTSTVYRNFIFNAATLLQGFTQDSATQTGWRRTKRSGDGKMIALYSPGICSLRYRSFP
jgi:hypothetical protein